MANRGYWALPFQLSCSLASHCISLKQFLGGSGNGGSPAPLAPKNPILAPCKTKHVLVTYPACRPFQTSFKKAQKRCGAIYLVKRTMNIARPTFFNICFPLGAVFVILSMVSTISRVSWE